MIRKCLIFTLGVAVGLCFHVEIAATRVDVRSAPVRWQATESSLVAVMGAQSSELQLC